MKNGLSKKGRIVAAHKDHRADATPERCPYCGGFDVRHCNEIGTDGTIWVGKCFECDRVFELSSCSQYDAEDGSVYTFGDDEE